MKIDELPSKDTAPEDDSTFKGNGLVDENPDVLDGDAAKRRCLGETTNACSGAKDLYDEYVKCSHGPLAVIGGIIALLTTRAGQVVQDTAVNTLKRVANVSEALPAVAKDIETFSRSFCPYLPYALAAFF